MCFFNRTYRKERTPAFHAVLRKYGRFTAAAAQRVASPVGPHRPVAATDADAEVPGDEVGQDAFNLDASAPIAPLFIKYGLVAQEMIVTPLEIGPRQVSDVSVQTGQPDRRQPGGCRRTPGIHRCGFEDPSGRA